MSRSATSLFLERKEFHRRPIKWHWCFSRRLLSLTYAIVLFLAVTPIFAESSPLTSPANTESETLVDEAIKVEEPAHTSETFENRLQQLEVEVARQRIENSLLRQALAGDQQAAMELTESERTYLGFKNPFVSTITSDSSLDHREPGISWLDGFRLQTRNDNFVMHIGGMAQGDGVWLSGNPNNVFAVPGGGSNGSGLDDAVDLRRARLLLSGTVYEFFDWALQYDFANTTKDDAGQGVPNAANSPAALNVDVTVREIPWIGNFRIGNMVTPIGLEHQQFAGFTDFMEFSYLFDAFYGQFSNGFAPGVMVFNQTKDQNATVSLGFFKQLNNAFGFGVGDGQNQVTGRATWTPWYDEPSDGRYLMHLGLGATHQDAVRGQARIRSRASLRNGPGAITPILVDTSELDCNGETIIAPELALVLGPLSFQAEYCASFLGNASVPGAPSQGTAFFQGFYVQSLYFLTGENREYDRVQGYFGRVRPFRNFYPIRNRGRNLSTLGAWQVGLRYDYLNLRDKAIDGGIAQDGVLGLNWIWNPNMRMQFNYVLTYRDAPQNVVSGVINGFGTRFEYDF